MEDFLSAIFIGVIVTRVPLNKKWKELVLGLLVFSLFVVLGIKFHFPHNVEISSLDGMGRVIRMIIAQSFVQ